MAKGRKTGGRKKGSTNKSTQSFKETLHSLGFNIAEEAVHLYKDSPSDIKLKLLTLLTSYSQQKPKPVEAPKPPKDKDDEIDESDELPDDTESLLNMVKR